MDEFPNILTTHIQSNRTNKETTYYKADDLSLFLDFFFFFSDDSMEGVAGAVVIKDSTRSSPLFSSFLFFCLCSLLALSLPSIELRLLLLFPVDVDVVTGCKSACLLVSSASKESLSKTSSDTVGSCLPWLRFRVVAAFAAQVAWNFLMNL